jgi:hypothetical protein
VRGALSAVLLAGGWLVESLVLPLALSLVARCGCNRGGGEGVQRLQE